MYSFSAIAQNQYTISGYVQDNESGENLIGVSIYDQKTYKGTASNQYGFYSLTMEEGNYMIMYSFIGYKTITKNITLNKSAYLSLICHILQNLKIEKGRVVVLHYHHNHHNPHLGLHALRLLWQRCR